MIMIILSFKAKKRFKALGELDPDNQLEMQPFLHESVYLVEI